MNSGSHSIVCSIGNVFRGIYVIEWVNMQSVLASRPCTEQETALFLQAIFGGGHRQAFSATPSVKALARRLN